MSITSADQTVVIPARPVTGTNADGWAWTYYGCPNYASGCPNIPHNCTPYASSRLMQNGVTLNWYDNANNWANQANSHGTTVDQSPAVGSIAHWNKSISVTRELPSI